MALLRCEGSPGEKYGYSNVLRENPTGREALVVWKHELYELGENPVRQELVDHYIEMFKFIRANAPPGVPPPPVASTDGVNFDRQPQPHERAALLAYLRKL